MWPRKDRECEFVRSTAIATLNRQRHLAPSCGGLTPTAEKTVGPARISLESLTRRPGIKLENYLLEANSCAAYIGDVTTPPRQRGLIKLAVDLHEGELSELRRIFSAISLICSLVSFFGAIPGGLQVSPKKASRPAGVTIQSRSGS